MIKHSIVISVAINWSPAFTSVHTPLKAVLVERWDLGGAAPRQSGLGTIGLLDSIIYSKLYNKLQYSLEKWAKKYYAN